MPNIRLIRAVVKPTFRHEQIDKQTHKQIVFLYIEILDKIDNIVENISVVVSNDGNVK